ncbi:hypothetical protein [Bacillus cereus]
MAYANVTYTSRTYPKYSDNNKDQDRKYKCHCEFEISRVDAGYLICICG